MATVKELKEALAKLPPELDDARVEQDGCDCVGDWNGEVDIDEKDKSICLRRN